MAFEKYKPPGPIFGILRYFFEKVMDGGRRGLEVAKAFLFADGICTKECGQFSRNDSCHHLEFCRFF